MHVRIRNRGALRKLSQRLKTSPRAMRAVAESGQEEILNLISAGFAGGKDPYGASWGAPNRLQITGRLRSYARGHTGPDGFEVHATDKKAIWHHDPQPREAGKSWTVKASRRKKYSTKSLTTGKTLKRRKHVATLLIGEHTAQWRKTWKLPTRLQVPTSARGMPASWQSALESATLEALRDWFD